MFYGFIECFWGPPLLFFVFLFTSGADVNIMYVQDCFVWYTVSTHGHFALLTYRREMTVQCIWFLV